MQLAAEKNVHLPKFTNLFKLPLDFSRHIRII